jgi:DNA-binding winged helix-turn-helix (wHTH) protein
MRRDAVVYRFGPFELHPATHRLLRDGQLVAVRDAAFAVLVHLVMHAPDVQNKEAIARAGWRGTASDASVEKVISRLRQLLDDWRGGTCIETVAGCGYRFVAAIEEIQAEETGVLTSRDSVTFLAFEKARRALMTLNRREIREARREFERTVECAPDYAIARVSLTLACVLEFEATRFDHACDLDALARAFDHAREGAALEPESAETLSALGVVLHVQGETMGAAGATRHADARHRWSWLNALLRGFASWGEDRIDAARTTLELKPGLALAYWLQATVFIARRAFDAALAVLREGCALQDRQLADAVMYPAVGLHLLRGLVLAAQDHLDEAAAAFDAELTSPNSRQLYWQECAANTWYALGGVRLRQRTFADAEAAFHRALEIAPGHLFSMAALGMPVPERTGGDRHATDAAIAQAIARARGNRHAEAAQAYAAMLGAAYAPNAGWLLPVEPVLCPLARPDIWDPVLTDVQNRAS